MKTIDGFPDYKIDRNGDVWRVTRVITRDPLPPDKYRKLSRFGTSLGSVMLVDRDGKSHKKSVAKLVRYHYTPQLEDQLKEWSR